MARRRRHRRKVYVLVEGEREGSTKTTMKHVQNIGLGVCVASIGMILYTGGASSRPLTQTAFSLGVIAICGAVLSLWR